MPQNYTIARVTKRGETYEVLVDPDLALKIRLGQAQPSQKVLVYPEVYRDAKKGIRAKEEELKKAFGTTDPYQIAITIVREGEVQLTAEQRRALIEEKRKKVVDLIARNAIDPRTNAPIPPQRVELAMKEVGVQIEPFVDASEQVAKVIERLRTVLPIKMALITIEVRVPGEFQPRVGGYLRGVGRILKEEWKGDGSWVCQVEAPGGMLGEVTDRVMRMTSGRGDVKRL
ncbi:MAG: ribosome assembly factor SBDS [Thaumarchaeota archaeon]|nr:ribosome assembly factor SBDS [Candidatus Calditenuaceae archaeon]MDW8042386.1 ribosome assembly factor SBDS [Nitrososphaerota archaeon]